MTIQFASKDTINQAIGQRVRDIRIKRELSGPKLAPLIGVNTSTVRQKETVATG